ncbi:MerR family transcriptional regulator [Deinococcus sp. Arct2-2]|uniref:MerR family transcriptional regulator n=1 Tax=Deinococcus sp. Arct2-2 TaxID=2568653 RepID=UPI0010A32B95|nr:MerR family transcriptional regulator [Deinococcus sp. Arct2-2]THF67899.1 MerR family transcriptional regulator [Deinococcus sp. Arct2-2]
MYKIGEFSIIAQVSGRLLRYYNEIGLFSPEFTDPQTGYRFYSAAQLPRLNRILAARELGFTLEQIARLLDGQLSLDELRGMLTLRKAQIEQTVQAEAERLRVVESRLRQIEDEGHSTAPDVVMKSVPAQPFLSLRELLPGLSAVRTRVEQLHSVVPKTLAQSNLGPITLVIHAPVFEPDALDFEIGYTLTGNIRPEVRLAGDRMLTVRNLPRLDLAATLVHVGPTSDTHRSYGLLAEWLEAHGWEVLGPGRQVLMQLPLRGPESEAVVELQLPVARPQPGP